MVQILFSELRDRAGFLKPNSIFTALLSSRRRLSKGCELYLTAAVAYTGRPDEVQCLLRASWRMKITRILNLAFRLTQHHSLSSAFINSE